jgi:hypothetical protein
VDCVDFSITGDYSKQKWVHLYTIAMVAPTKARGGSGPN